MENLTGGTAVITGGATGIGRALALQLAHAGMNIVLASTNRQRLNDAAEAVRSVGGAVTTVVCDVSDRTAVHALSQRAVAVYGKIDLLCANAGVSTTGPYLDHRPSDWDWVYDVVLKGTANCIQVFYPQMARRGRGHILITGSQAGLVPDWVTEHGPYTSAKAAVMALGAALRPEAAQHGVGVSVLVPGGVATDIRLAERSRPERYGAPLDVGTRTERSQGARGDGMDLRRLEPSEVAMQVIEGIRTNAAWIATHPEYRSLTANYFDRILAAYGQTSGESHSDQNDDSVSHEQNGAEGMHEPVPHAVDDERHDPEPNAAPGGAATTGHGDTGGSAKKTPTPKGIGQRRTQMASFVSFSDDGEREIDESGDEAPERSPVDAAGVQRVLEFEESCGRVPTEQAHNNPGFDVMSCDEGGNVLRRIEIKSIGGAWTGFGVWMSATQLEENRAHGDDFWLYVVEHAEVDDAATIHRIQDPVGQATKFGFDAGWQALREPDTERDDAGKPLVNSTRRLPGWGTS